MTTSTVLSCLQIAALLYLGIAAIRINRLQTLAKNFDWVIPNSEFSKKNGEPVYWPLIVMGIALYGFIIASVLVGSISFLLIGKYFAIFAASVILYAAYYFIDKQVSAQIPLKIERTASLTKRTLAAYVHPTLILSAKLSVVLVVIADTLSFLVHKITLASFVYDMGSVVFGYGSIWVGIILGLKENMPHQNDITQVTTINVGENYRRFSMNFLIGLLFFLSLVAVFYVGLQWFGFDIVRDPSKEALHRLFGEPVPAFRPVFTYQQWDGIFSLLTCLFCVIMVKSKPFRDILSIKIKPDQCG